MICRPGRLNDRGQDIENLWLVDERLVFHRLLASDKPVSTLRGFLASESTGTDHEPDIVIFDPAFVTTEGEDLHASR